MIKTSLYISIFLLVFNCNPSEISEEEEYIPQGTVLRVNSYTETCQGLIEMQCFLVQEGDQIGTDRWEFCNTHQNTPNSNYFEKSIYRPLL